MGARAVPTAAMGAARPHALRCVAARDFNVYAMRKHTQGKCASSRIGRSGQLK